MIESKHKARQKISVKKQKPTKQQKTPLTQNQQQKITQTQIINPRFPFNKVQICFHFIFITFIVIICVYKYIKYILQHQNQLIQTFQSSWLTEIMQNHPKIFNKQKLYRYSADPQWQAYRSSLHVLFILAIIWRAITYIYEITNKLIVKNSKQLPIWQNQGQYNQNQDKIMIINKVKTLNYINKYIFMLSLVFLCFAFRADIIYYLFIIITWWFIIQCIIYIQQKRQNIFMIRKLTIQGFNNICIIFLWSIILITLYLNEKYSHFQLLSEWFQQNLFNSKLFAQIQFISAMKNSYRKIHCSQLLNMTFLRLLSYAVDRLKVNDIKYIKKEKQLRIKRLVKCDEQCQLIQIQPKQSIKLYNIQKNQQRCKQQEITLYCYKGRDHIIKQKHNFIDYLNYTLYTPLLFTGPPITYNNFFSYFILPGPSLKLKSFLYHLLLIFLFQLHLHILPVIPITQTQTLIQMELFSLLHLIFIWFKFLIIWRTAKIWSQYYHINVIDNMSRCICNNYGFQGFWRMWHKGFNVWLVKYLYIPLGGNNNIFSVVLVVAFVAFWHDHTINIIFWALIMCLFMVPQILIKRYFRSRYPHLFEFNWFKYLSCFSSAVYIYFLIICNLIGFGYGYGKMQILLDKLKQNIVQLIFSIFVVMNAVMLMFYQRNMEKIKRKY